MPERFEELILGLTRQPGEGWGLNINNASFTVTKISATGAAAKTVDPPRVGDLLVGVAGADGRFTLLDSTTRASEMRDAFANAGDVCQLRVKRQLVEADPPPPSTEGARRRRAPPAQESDDPPPRRASSEGMLTRWGRSFRRRSTSVDARLRSLGSTLASAFGSQEATRAPGDVVQIWPRVYAVVGGQAPDLKRVAEACGRMCQGEARTHAEFNHTDALDEEPLLRALLINVGDAPCLNPHLFAGGARVINAGWEAPKHAPGPALAHAARLGLAAAAWLALDDGGRTVVVIGDLTAGDRARCGLACAAVLRVASAVLEFGELQTDVPRVDSSSEAYGAYLNAVGGDALRQLDLGRLPPSFGRGLKHLDCAVEARCLPNPRPLVLLGAAVRGLPVSEAPVLEVCSTSTNWSSEADDMATDWDGDEAFYSLDNNSARPCVLRGDFAVVVRFGGRYRDVGGAGQAPIARYVASSGFLCDGAIDARKCDIDVHPAYAQQILGDKKNAGTDLRVRLAFAYADDQGDDAPTSPRHFFALPRKAEAAVDRGLALIAAWHCMRPDATLAAFLAGTACCDEDVASLALQLGANDESKAFAVVSTFPTLAAAADMRRKHGDLFAYVDASRAALPSSNVPVSATSLLNAAQAGPGGLPRTALNQLGGRKVRPQRKPSLPPPPLNNEARPAPVQPPAVLPPPTDADLLTAELDALLARPSRTLADVAVPGMVGSFAPGLSPAAAPAGSFAPGATAPAAPIPAAAAAAAPAAPANPLESMLRARAPPPAAPAANPLEAMLQRRQAPPPPNLSRIISGEAAPDTNALNSMLAARAPPAAGAAAAGAKLRDHPAMKPFVKLLKVGLPKGAVARKMAEEGLDAALLDKDLDAPPDAEALRMLNREAAPARAWGDRKARKRASLKPVHWEAIENNTEGTVWADSGDGVDDADKAELHRLFGVDHSKTRKRGSQQPKHRVEEEACEAKRSANIAISLATLAKPFEGDAGRLLRAASVGEIGADIIGQLVPMLPSDEEFAKARALYRKSGPKKLRTPQKPAEALFVAVVDLVQDGDFDIQSPADLRGRLQALGEALSAPDAAKKVQGDSLVLIAAADGARTSKALAESLRRLLDVGNALNAGTRRGDAKGFTLASLERVAATKSTEGGSVSVLDFAARKPLSGAGDAGLAELEPLLRAARKLELKDLAREATRLERCAARVATGVLAAHGAVHGLAAHAAAAARASTDAAASVGACAKFFGEDAPDCGHLFGALHDLVSRFQAARSKAKADDERKAKLALEAKRATPETKRERRRERRRGRASVDDVLRAVDAGKK